MIDVFPGLTNLTRGHGSANRGPMHSVEIIARFELPELELHPDNHKLILINVNQSVEDTSRSTLYDQVRFAWRISKPKAEQADFVLAVVRGVIKGAFVAKEWLPVTRENFPSFVFTEANRARVGFKGEEASGEIQDWYVDKIGKRIVEPDMRHIQNPVRYWNI